VEAHVPGAVQVPVGSDSVVFFGDARQDQVVARVGFVKRCVGPVITGAQHQPFADHVLHAEGDNGLVFPAGGQLQAHVVGAGDVQGFQGL